MSNHMSACNTQTIVIEEAALMMIAVHLLVFNKVLVLLVKLSVTFSYNFSIPNEK